MSECGDEEQRLERVENGLRDNTLALGEGRLTLISAETVDQHGGRGTCGEVKGNYFGNEY